MVVGRHGGRTAADDGERDLTLDGLDEDLAISAADLHRFTGLGFGLMQFTLYLADACGFG